MTRTFVAPVSVSTPRGHLLTLLTLSDPRLQALAAAASVAGAVPASGGAG